MNLPKLLRPPLPGYPCPFHDTLNWCAQPIFLCVLLPLDAPSPNVSEATEMSPVARATWQDTETKQAKALVAELAEEARAEEEAARSSCGGVGLGQDWSGHDAP